MSFYTIMLSILYVFSPYFNFTITANYLVSDRALQKAETISFASDFLESNAQKPFSEKSEG